MTRAEARPKKRDSLPVLSPLRPFHLARAVLRHHGPRMPPGREKDTSDRFHPATRKATSNERHFSPLLSSFSRLFLLSSPRPALSYRRRFFLAFETGFAFARSLACSRGQWSSASSSSSSSLPIVRPRAFRAKTLPSFARSKDGNARGFFLLLRWITSYFERSLLSLSLSFFLYRQCEKERKVCSCRKFPRPGNF